jgi:DNA (cytosine-5)-methyltransferase 1
LSHSPIQRAPLRTIELFAGVGGFRLGLSKVQASELSDLPGFAIGWSNQWEPSTKRQDASDVYAARWGAQGHTNEDIFALVNDDDKFASIASYAPEVLVGGFPCQDYSVACSSDKSKGLEGKKGVLWWAIHTTLRRLLEAGQPVKHLIFENVDRLLKSPAKAPGRDFSIILASLAELGYRVEWRVVNAADYGFPQKRTRVFIVAHHESTALGEACKAFASAEKESYWLLSRGTLAQSLPAVHAPRNKKDRLQRASVGCDVLAIQTAFDQDGQTITFENAGVMVDGQVATLRVKASVTDFTPFVGQAKAVTLGDVVRLTEELGVVIPEDYYLNDSSLAAWQHVKGAKSADRVAATGFAYTYKEGALAFPDVLDKPARTIITSEGGASASRTTHVVEDSTGRLRRLVPDELEELNGFPRGFTAHAGVRASRRAFMMGNALVTGVVTAIGQKLLECAAHPPSAVEDVELDRVEADGLHPKYVEMPCDEPVLAEAYHCAETASGETSDEETAAPAAAVSRRGQSMGLTPQAQRVLESPSPIVVPKANDLQGEVTGDAPHG